MSETDPDDVSAASDADIARLHAGHGYGGHDRIDAEFGRRFPHLAGWRAAMTYLADRHQADAVAEPFDIMRMPERSADQDALRAQYERSVDGLLAELLAAGQEPDDTYQPVDVTPIDLDPEGTLALSVIDGWAERTTDPARIDWTPRQAAALIPFEVVDGRPVNPNGRTGRVGRNLGKWGENQAADPIVVADTVTGTHVLLIQRGDCGQWAIPGGMVDPGETAPAALVRELHEETCIDLTALTPEILSRTYVDDPRNTDEAWVCSTVALYRVDRLMDSVAGSDAADARWFPFTSLPALRASLAAIGGQLYPAHGPLLDTARRHLDRS